MGLFNKNNTPPKQIERKDIENIDEMLDLTRKLLSYTDSTEELNEICEVLRKHPFKYKKSYKLHDCVHSITTYYNSNPNSALLTGNTAIITKETDTAIIEYAYKTLIIRDYRNSAISLVEDAISNGVNSVAASENVISEPSPMQSEITVTQEPSDSESSSENTNSASVKKFCPYCGTKLVHGAKFCPGCGKPI